MHVLLKWSQSLKVKGSSATLDIKHLVPQMMVSIIGSRTYLRVVNTAGGIAYCLELAWGDLKHTWASEAQIPKHDLHKS